MTTGTVTDTDIRLREAVVHQLDRDPEVDASEIGVTARDGVVTLTGFTERYTGKLAAERIVKRVRGVRAVANDIEVRLLVDRTDSDIAHDAVQALKTMPALADTVQVVVNNGRITLTGSVEWLCQKDEAENAVKDVRGLLGTLNHITVKPRSGQRDVQRRIARALHRNADIDARHIGVAVADDVATLTGTVGTWMQREAAERAAGSAPGITRVDNEIIVVPVEPHEVEPVDEIC